MPIGQLDRLDQRHAEDVGVEVHRPLHVAAHQRQVVDAPELELVVGRPIAGGSSYVFPDGPARLTHAQFARAREPQGVAGPGSPRRSSGCRRRSSVGPAPGGHPCQGLYHARVPPAATTAFIATHYNVDFSEHYLAERMAERGYGFLGWNTRFRGAEAVLPARPRAGRDRRRRALAARAGASSSVVLLGNSGGGSLMSAYHSQCTRGDDPPAVGSFAAAGGARPRPGRPVRVRGRPSRPSGDPHRLARPVAAVGDRPGRPAGAALARFRADPFVASTPRGHRPDGHHRGAGADVATLIPSRVAGAGGGGLAGALRRGHPVVSSTSAPTG